VRCVRRRRRRADQRRRLSSGRERIETVDYRPDWPEISWVTRYQYQFDEIIFWRTTDKSIVYWDKEDTDDSCIYAPKSCWDVWSKESYLENTSIEIIFHFPRNYLFYKLMIDIDEVKIESHCFGWRKKYTSSVKKVSDPVFFKESNPGSNFEGYRDITNAYIPMSRIYYGHFEYFFQRHIDSVVKIIDKDDLLIKKIEDCYARFIRESEILLQEA